MGFRWVRTEPQVNCLRRYRTTSGLIMSCSSCSRMWQCHTYSWPPVLGLVGMGKGTDGKLNCMITLVTSPGFMRTVSFHPASYGAGANGAPDRFATPFLNPLKAWRETIC